MSEFSSDDSALSVGGDNLSPNRSISGILLFVLGFAHQDHFLSQVEIGSLGVLAPLDVDQSLVWVLVQSGSSEP